MDYIGIFYDYDEHGYPVFAIHDEDENWLFSVTLPKHSLDESPYEIGDECHIKFVRDH